MKLPPGKTEQEVVDIMYTIANRLAANFKFGCYTTEDMRQQVFLFACQGLDGYDCNRPLENFLFVHVKNRLINFKRDNYKRTDCPCKVCYQIQWGGPTHPGGKYCDKYLLWQNKNIIKQNIISPLDISCISDENEMNTREESVVVLNVEITDILERIDMVLPIDLRHYYLRMKEGVSIPKNKRLEIEEIVNTIIKKDEDGETTS